MNVGARERVASFGEVRVGTIHTPTEVGGRSEMRVALLEEVRVELVERLRARLPEIQSAVFAQVRAMSEPPDDAERAAYVAGMHAAVVDGLDYALTGIEQGDDWSAPIPAAAVDQARRAARNGVSLDTVLRRYAAGERQLAQFILDEADGLPSQSLRHVLRTHGLQVDRFMAAVAAEYVDQLDRAAQAPEQRLAECVDRLLAGEPVDVAKLGYELEGRWHMGIVVMGAGAIRAVKDLAESVNFQLLWVPRGERIVWAWLGGRRRPTTADLERFLSVADHGDLSFVTGEPVKGIDGWRLTHRQAQAAVWVALRRPQPLTRYADDPLLAAALGDDVLAMSLREIYALPLCDQRDRGKVSRTTLRAYFVAGHNAATAAALLRVDRHTVQRRLRKIEERLGRRLHTCYGELEVALRLYELDEPKQRQPDPDDAPGDA